MAGTPRNLYVPLDVNYPRDPKVRRAGPEAELLFLRSLAHCKGGRTDGVIHDFDLEVVAVGLNRVQSRVDSLIKVGLWETVPEGWRVVNWTKWNPLNADLDDRKEKQRKAAIATNHKVHHVGKDKFSRSCPLCLESLS